MSLPIIIDCDPGLDDAIALAMALNSPELDVKAITISAGNQTPDKTLDNALRLLELMGRNDIPVAAGAAQPLFRKLVVAAYVHGETGMGNTHLPETSNQPVAENAVEIMARLLKEAAEPLTLVVIGPMTNIALLFMQYPELKSKIACIVFMGGGVDAGNITPVAEFNFYVDPEAASLVLDSGVPLVMAGLNVTHQAYVLPEENEVIRALGNPVAKAVAEILDFYLPAYLQHPRGIPGAAMHDPCTIAWLLAPDLFQSERRWVGVETKGKYTLGMSIMDKFDQTDRPANVKVLTGVDREGFVRLMIERLKGY